MCTTVGVQATCAGPALRVLASSLCDAGWLVLRFDWRGTGDSAGTLEDDGRTARWTEDAREAVGFLRAAGAGPLALVGVRLGATVAAVAADVMDELDHLVLWDPCEDGRSFLREQKVLRAAAVEEPALDSASGAAEILGAVLPAPLVADLEALSVPTGRVLAGRTLILTRPERTKARRTLSAVGGHVEFADAEGQAELVDVLPNQAAIPHDTLRCIVRWLDDARSATSVPVLALGADEATVRVSDDDAVVEHAVRLGSVGLFGIVSQTATSSTRAPVVFLNAGLIDHAGPARLWVELARDLAAQGHPTLRFDLSGLGASPPREGQPDSLMHPLGAMDDIEVAVRSIGAVSGVDAGSAALVGLCSGAYHAIEAGLVLCAGPGEGIGVGRVAAINPILHFDPPAAWLDADHGRHQRTAQPFRPWIQRLRRFTSLARFAEHRLPPSVWWVLDRVGLQEHPGRGIKALADRGVSTLLVCGDVEARHFERRAKWAVRRAERQGALRFEVLPGSDHTLFGASSRRRVAEIVRQFVSEPAVENRADVGELAAGPA